jgi:UDP-glucose 4-epimerase
MAEKVLVTGGTGFIGSHLVLELLKQGNEVVVIGNPATKRSENLDLFNGEIEYFEKDISDTLALTALCKGVRYVYHLAAISSVQKSIENPLDTNRVNIDGMLSILVAARDAGAQRVIFSSSADVYGNSKEMLKIENIPVGPISPYAIQKIAGEQYMQQFSKFFAVETVSLRYFNVFGPRQEAGLSYATIIPLFISLMKDGIAPTIYGDGSTVRDYVYVQDVVDASILAAQSKEANGEIYNVGSGIPTSIQALFEIIEKTLDISLTPQYDPHRFSGIQHSFADISKARAILGYKPKISLEDGIKMVIKSLEP